MREIKRIYIHHSQSPKTTTLNQIKEWHLANGWSDIGYHYVINGEGVVKRGRDNSIPGAHVANEAKTEFDNRETLGICVTGNFDVEHPELEQIARLETLLVSLCMQYNIHPSHILGHRDFKGVTKTCPGENLYNIMNDLRFHVDRKLNPPKIGWLERILRYLIKVIGGD